MIDPVSFPDNAKPAKQASPGASVKAEFDAALKAAQQAAAREEAWRNDVAAIAEKGFGDWARDTQIETLKEKLRRKVMAEMGLDEQQLERMGAVIRQIIEQKIAEEVERRLEEEVAEQEQTTTGKVAAEPGKNVHRGGKSCPVIPALAWPGGASVL